MATPLNQFKHVQAELTTINSVAYTAPVGFTSIVLMAQIANVTSTTGDVTMSHVNPVTSDETELVKDFTVPGNDSLNPVSGKLILEAGQQIFVQSSHDNRFKLSLSILESLNA